MQMQQQQSMEQERKQCHFCTSNREVINYKDSESLKRFMSSQGKIYPRKKTGLCARNQRALATAVKRARYLALVPYTNR